jgi:hypothetical protein
VNWKGFYKIDGDLHITAHSRVKGVIWVTGEISQTGIFELKGLVYSQGDMQFNASVWVLGALATEGASVLLVQPVNGNATLLYSSEAIRQAISAGQGYTTIAWSEQ